MISAHDEALYENALDAINQLKYNYRIAGVSQMWNENSRIVKTVTKKEGFKTNFLDYEANRLVFNERYSIYIYVLYFGKLPKVLSDQGLTLRYSLPQCADHIKLVLDDCKYVLHYNRKTNTYWFYDQYNKKKLITFEDYAKSLYLKDDMKKLVNSIHNVLRNDTSDDVHIAKDIKKQLAQ